MTKNVPAFGRIQHFADFSLTLHDTGTNHFNKKSILNMAIKKYNYVKIENKIRKLVLKQNNVFNNFQHNVTTCCSV